MAANTQNFSLFCKPLRWLLLFWCGLAAAEGQLCVVGPQAGVIGGPGASGPLAVVTAVVVDTEAARPLASSVVFTGLALDGRHSLRLFSGEQVVESFYWLFPKGETRLCLWQHDFYRSWRLTLVGESGLEACRCAR